MTLLKELQYNVLDKEGNVLPNKSIAISVKVDTVTSKYLIHKSLVIQDLNRRQGTASSKTRSEVKGGGKKPWKQKGTGSARAGTIRSPLWRGGGVVFAAVPRDFKQKVNKKMYRIAISCILSELVRQKRLEIVDQFTVEQPKTKEVLNKLKTHKINANISGLVITDKLEQELYLAARNIPYLSVCEVGRINPVNLIKHEKVVITKQAISNLNEALR